MGIWSSGHVGQVVSWTSGRVRWLDSLVLRWLLTRWSGCRFRWSGGEVAVEPLIPGPREGGGGEVCWQQAAGGEDALIQAIHGLDW